jgi:hypothetical protein
MDNLPDALARLTDRLENLERRVTALEHPNEAPTPSASPAAAVEKAAATDETWLQAGGVFPVIGKAMLGIAGAYLLRAVAESGSFPKLAVVALALAYAAMWLVWSARVPVDARFASAAYAATAALILAPMLWELTLVFKVLSTTVAAGVLGTFVAAAFALAWKRNSTPLVWVVTVTATPTALALLIVSHDLVPFIAALLFMALVSEAAACRSRWLGLRPVVAAGADLATALLVYIGSRPESARPDYVSTPTATLLTLPAVLFLIYAASTTLRIILQRQRITVFEIGQMVIAFLLCTLGAYNFSANLALVGISCLALSVACYAAAFAWFDRITNQRNYQVFATWGAALFLTGSLLLLPPLALAWCLSLASIAVTLLGVRTIHLTLEFHGLLFLTSAAWVSGLLDYAGRALGGAFPVAPGKVVWIVAASGVLCYVIDRRGRGARWNERLLQLLAAILAVSAVATFLVSALVWLAESGVTPAIHHVAVIRTLITCLLALALAFSGSRWRRGELVWIAYGALGLVSAKLLFEDLQHGHPGSIAISIFLYAVALILVPRMARLGRHET